MKDTGLNTLPIINIALTVLIGILALTSESISTVDYIFMWLMLIIHEVVIIFLTEK